jgi:NAD(P)-dependent dehydrogenase (short-subunit alcohol dehydrogenase family)
MSSTSPVLLILGSGPRIGSHVARAFAAKGYKVALASRKVKEADNTADQINIPSDLSDPNSVVNAFSKVKELIGTPSVVVYNGQSPLIPSNLLINLAKSIFIFLAGAVTFNDAKDHLSLPVADFARDFTINTTSAFVAAQQAVLSFKELPDSAARTFIYTGNITNEIPLAPLLDLGVGKSATAHIIQSAAAAYKDKGYK